MTNNFLPIKAITFGCFLYLSACCSIGLSQGDSASESLAVYADAAEFQNNGAYKLAIEEWQKFLKEFPKDPLVGKAHHYLGVAFIQEQKYDKAIAAFRKALGSKKLDDVREETLINLSWCQFNNARSAEPGSRTQRVGFVEAKKSLGEFMNSYGKGKFADQALFYLGEIEYSEGNARKSIGYYKQLLDSKRFKESPLRADALYAIAVAYEEQKDLGQAARNYQELLKEHPDHRLVQEVSVRTADILLSQNKAAEAARLLSAISVDGALADYTLLRLGYALSKQGRNDDATQKYLELLKRYPNSQHAPTAAISVGQALYKAGRYDEAVTQFRKALKKKDAQAADAAHWIAITLNRQNKSPEAVKVLEDAMEWADENVTLQMDYADALYSAPNQLGKARTAYELIANEHSDHPLAPRAAYNAAFAALQLRDYEKARKWSEWFLKRFPEDPLRNDVGYVVAETLLQSGEHKAAAQAYQRLRQADSKNPSYDFWTLRHGMSLYLGGEYKDAIKLIRGAMPALKQDMQKAEAQFILGASLLYDEQLKDAIQQLMASHRTSDQWSSADEVLLLLSEAQERSKDNAAAKKTLELLLKKYPRSRLKSQAEYKLGQLSAASGNFRDAVSRYRSIVSDPDASSLHNFARYGIAWSLMQQEDYAGALKDLDSLLDNNVGGSVNAEAQLAKGVCLRKLGRTSEATKALQDFLAGSPKGASLGNGLYEIGLAYTDRQELETANRYLERILREVPDYAAKDKVLYELAWNYEDAGKSKEASRYFEQLQAEYPKSEFGAEAAYMIAQQHYSNKKYGKAVRVYQSVLDATNDPELLEKSLYKLGWSYFEQDDYRNASQSFGLQISKFPRGALLVDGLFMSGECAFKQDDYTAALPKYQKARQRLEVEGDRAVASKQVQSLIYLHGAQCYREQKDWRNCESWLTVITKRFPESPYFATTLYEMGFCKQKQNQIKDALKYYSEVANTYRTVVGARARFMMGEVYFAQRDFAKAIPEFQRVMYGFGGDRAPEEIKNWQVKSAFEAARCSEVLIESLRGTARKKVIETAQEFYAFIVDKHAAHDLAAQAQSRLGELQKLR